jgi:hypothetical protein
MFIKNILGKKMENKQGITGKLFHDYRLIPILPAVCVILDYAMTFYFAGDPSMIIRWEASPIVRFAVMNNILIPCLIAIILFYYLASYAVLRILAGTVYYKFGVLLIITMSITHIVGGMSWYFRNSMYSNGVMLVSLLSIAIAVIVFGFSFIRERHSVHW